MAEWGWGFKAGCIDGLFHGIIAKFLFLYLIYISSPAILNLKDPLTLFLSVLFIGIIDGTIGGAILGLFFAATYEKLPFTHSMAKGLILGTIFWIVFSEIRFDIVIQGLFLPYTAFNISLVSGIEPIIVNFAISLFSGPLLGFIWSKYSRSYRYEFSSGMG